MHDIIKTFIIPAALMVASSAVTWFFSRRKSDADITRLISEATTNVVQTLMDEQKRQSERISHLESQIEDIHKQIEALLDHPGETVPKSEIAKITRRSR